MSDFDGLRWKRFESGSPTAFLVAGVVLLGYAGLKSIELVTSTVTPDVLKVTIGHVGLLIPVFGLLGLYPLVRDATPRLSRAGVMTSAVSGVCSIVLLVAVTHLTLTMAGYPAIPEDTGTGLLPPLWGATLLIVSLLTILLGFFLFGVASLRTDAVSQTVSYLLLVPVATWIGLFLMTAVGVDGTVIGTVVYVPIGASLLAIGSRLRNTSVPTDRGQPSTDPTV